MFFKDGNSNRAPSVIVGMSKDELSHLREKSVSVMQDCASNIYKHIQQKEQPELLKDLSKTLQSYCEMDYDLEVYNMTLQLFENNPSLIDEDVDENLKKFQSESKKIRNKFVKDNETHPILEDFRKKYIKNQLPGNLEDSDIIETEYSDEFIDPITKKTIQNPVKNKICGHVYENTSIKELIKMNPRIRCPVVGCANREFITERYLIADNRTLKRLSQA